MTPNDPTPTPAEAVAYRITEFILSRGDSRSHHDDEIYARWIAAHVEREVSALRAELERARETFGCINDHPSVRALQRDKERLDWLEAHPLKTEVHGGVDDGHVGRTWAVAANSSFTLREAIDTIAAISAARASGEKGEATP